MDTRNFPNGRGDPKAAGGESCAQCLVLSQAGMLRANAACVQAGYHLGFCSVWSFMDTFLWEGLGKPSFLSFISSFFFMKNIPFAPFGSFNGTTCCQPLSENCCCVSLCFAFTPLVFPSLKQLCLFPHLSPELLTASQLFWACICVPPFP